MRRSRCRVRQRGAGLARSPQPWIAASLTIALLALPCAGAPLAAATGASSSTADHGKFESLKRDFSSGPEVTRACLECHTQAAQQIHKTTHWTWEFENTATGQRLGKRHVVNNFCISTASNIAACSSCHVGYGWQDGSFDFSAEENVDCLVCHDTTGTYSKDPKKRQNLSKLARKVGPTSRATCGACHFKGGGGAAVKHGDLDPTLVAPDVFVDVHMDADGLDFTCATCHAGAQHAIAGSRYAPTASDSHGIDIPGRHDGSRASCQSCHGERPHAERTKLDDHTDRIACQTCHIPQYSRGNFPSKEWWDWSTAGELKPDATSLSRFDADGHEIYSSKKGDFRWQSDVTPSYVWFNGTVLYTLLGDTIDPSGVVPINRFLGDAEDADARIWPVKVMRGKQPYDKDNLTIAVPHTVGEDGFWKTYDWGSALKVGMQAAGVPYSGNFGFVETRMLWPISHMVAPKEEALGCEACHARNGRLHGIDDVYVPGRDANATLDRLGAMLLALTALGVCVHAALRVTLRHRSDEGTDQ